MMQTVPWLSRDPLFPPLSHSQFVHYHLEGLALLPPFRFRLSPGRLSLSPVFGSKFTLLCPYPYLLTSSLIWFLVRGAHYCNHVNFLTTTEIAFRTLLVAVVFLFLITLCVVGINNLSTFSPEATTPININVNTTFTITHNDRVHLSRLPLPPRLPSPQCLVPSHLLSTR